MMFSGDIETAEIPDGGLELAPGLWLFSDIDADEGLGRYLMLTRSGAEIIPADAAWHSLRKLFQRETQKQEPDGKYKVVLVKLFKWLSDSCMVSQFSQFGSASASMACSTIRSSLISALPELESEVVKP